jgi:dTMP kinase
VIHAGAFITFEGGEGAGKSTQIRHLAEALMAAGHRVVVTREPGGTPFAEAIRGVLLGPEAPRDAMTQALLFAAARREHIRALIGPALMAGSVVLCDRFTDSTRAYQGGALGVEAIEATILLATGGLAPDLTLLLDLPPETGLARARRRAAAVDTFETADLAFHHDVRARFLAYAREEATRFAVIDAAADEASVATSVLAAVNERLGEHLAEMVG